MKKSPKEQPVTDSPFRRALIIGLALAYLAAATCGAWEIITHSEASTDAIDKILSLYNLKNEGEQTFERFDKEHPILGGLFGGTIHKEMKLPSAGESSKALYSDVARHLKKVREESHITAWWSWGLLSFSLFYVLAVITVERSVARRAVLFAATAVSVVFFVIGIFAPAMVIWTAPTIPMATGNLDFVVQHEIRGIAAIIWQLLTGGHWLIGGFLLLFTIVTPITKASLTFFTTFNRNTEVNARIASFLHAIGRWSMADVFVAAILLALYALKFQQATKSIPCIGLYYFIGYCLLSMTNTSVMVHGGVADGTNERKSRRKLGFAVIAGLFLAFLCFAGASSLYTYEQYTVNTKQDVRALGEPSKLDNRDLVLPVHKLK